jgi:hypothetical protein
MISTRWKLGGIAFAGLVISAGLLLFARSGFPPMLDAAYQFCPPAIALKGGQGLINPFTEWAFLDATGQARFLWYPPLQQLVLASLMGRATAEHLYVAMAWGNVVTLWICACLFSGAVQRKSALSGLSAAAVVVGLLGMGSLFAFYLWGRPEWLATLLLSLGVLLYVQAPLNVLPWGFGCLLGLMAATHPAATLMSTQLIGMAFCLRVPADGGNPVLSILKKTAGAGVLGLVLALGVLAMGPHGLHDTLHGIRTHAAIAVPLRFSLPPWDVFVRVFVAHYQYPLWGLMVLWMPFLVYRLAMRPERISSRPACRLLFVFLLNLYVLIGFFVFSGNREYNAIWMVPLMLFICLWAQEENLPRLFKGVSWVLMLGLSTGFLRTALLYPFYLREGLQLKDARERFEHLKRQHPGDTVYRLSYSLWALSEDYPHMRVLESPARAAREMYVIQQNYMGPGFLRPPEIKGLIREADFFQDRVPRLWGVRLASTIPGYGFAVYRPDARHPPVKFEKKDFY